MIRRPNFPDACQRRKDWLAKAHARNPRCVYCLRVTQLAKRWSCGPQCATVDHYMPLSLGGLDEPRNWRLCCRWCNELKADYHPAEFMRQIEAA